jgi:amino acid transporter
MTKYVAYADLSDSSNLPHLLFAENLLGRPGAIWMTIVTMFACVSTANTVLGTIPGIISGMAKNDMMPIVFTRKNRFGAPVVGLFAFSAVVLIEILAEFANSAGLVNVLLAASCFWLTSYIFVSITVLSLRKRYPGHPGRSKRLKLWGLPQIICIIGDVFMIWNIAEGDSRILIYKIFFVILAVLIVYAVVWTKFIKKSPMFKGASLDDVLYSEYTPH